MKTIKAIKHGVDWCLARVIVGIAGMAFLGAVFILPAAIAELLCRAVGLV